MVSEIKQLNYVSITSGIILTYCIIAGIKVTVETVIIINHRLHDGAAADIIPEVSEFMENYTFTHKESLVSVSNTFYLKTEYHKYFPAQNVDAENYNLISVINEGNGNDSLSWYEIKDDYKEFIENLATGEYYDDNTWSIGLFPLENVHDGDDSGPVDMPLLGISVTLSYQQSCAKYPDVCDKIRGAT